MEETFHSESCAAAARIKRIIDAYMIGKKIEFYNNSSRQWEDITNPTWSHSMDNYKIKDEPEYRPFTFEEAKKIVGCMVVHKVAGERYLILAAVQNGVYLLQEETTFKSLLEYYTNIDGKPMGIRIE